MPVRRQAMTFPAGVTLAERVISARLKNGAAQDHLAGRWDVPLAQRVRHSETAARDLYREHLAARPVDDLVLAGTWFGRYRAAMEWLGTRSRERPLRAVTVLGIGAGPHRGDPRLANADQVMAGGRMIPLAEAGLPSHSTFDLFELSRLVGPTGRLHGVDFDARVLAIAEACRTAGIYVHWATHHLADSRGRCRSAEERAWAAYEAGFLAEMGETAFVVPHDDPAEVIGKVLRWRPERLSPWTLHAADIMRAHLPAEQDVVWMPSLLPHLDPYGLTSIALLKAVAAAKLGGLIVVDDQELESIGEYGTTLDVLHVLHAAGARQLARTRPHDGATAPDILIAERRHTSAWLDDQMAQLDTLGCLSPLA